LQCIDGEVYNITDLGCEGRWYLLSVGVNGRMIDGTERDFSKYLNQWNGLVSYSDKKIE